MSVYLLPLTGIDYMFRFHKYYVHLFLIALGVVLYFFANFHRVAVPGAVFGLLQQKLGVSAPYITALGASFMYTYAVSQIFMGRMVERYGGLRIIALGALFFTAGALLFPNTHTMPLLYLSRVMSGFGAGCFYLSLVRELERCIPDRNFGVSLSITVFLGYLGSFAANAPFVWFIERFGLFHVLDYTGFVILAVSVLFILTGARFQLTSINTGRHFELDSYRHVLCNRYNICLFLFGALNYALMYVLQTVVGKKFLEDICMFSSEKAAWVLSAMSVISAVSSMGLAFLSRYFGGRKIIFFKISAVISVVAFVFVTLSLIFSFRSGLLVSMLFCCLAAVATMSPLLVVVISEVNPHSVSVTATGIMNALFFFSVGIMGNLTGFMMNLFPACEVNGILVYGRNSYLAVFLPLLLFSFAELYFAFRLEEPGKKKLNQK